MPQTAIPRRIVTLEEVTVNAPAETLAEARTLLFEYGQFVLSNRAMAGFCYGSLEKEAERLPVSYTERGGGCLLARTDGVSAGFVAWRDISSDALPSAWEVKRLWVRPASRGLSLGRTLTQFVLDRAADFGRKAVYLDTVPAAMAEAHKLYLTMDFTPCPRYNDNPVVGVEFLMKLL
jgi:GNAT superfamily N-acetyltransferase